MNTESQVAKFILQIIQTLMKKQCLIAKEAGFDNPIVITMIKQGKTKLRLPITI